MTPVIPVTSQTETLTPTMISTETQTSVSTLTFSAAADARVEQVAPDKNFGNGTTLRADGGSDPAVESFLTFTVTGVAGNTQHAILRLYVPENGSKNGPAVYSTDPSWTEDKITWNTRPAPISEAVDNKEEIQPGTWVEYDVTSLVTGNGAFSFLLIADSNDSTVFSSRQGEQPPQLVVTLGTDLPLTLTPASIPSQTPTTSSDESVVFVGTGDISDCDNNNDELTAQLLDTIPGTVFTTGDNAYSKGTSTQFADCYGPTWGRFKDRTKPIPGNHEYRTADASGYFQYFDNIPSYYAYDLGSWRIYALNSEIDVSPTSEQVIWLVADLTTNPRQCVLAYWHQPRWSSGSHHGSNPDYQTLWQIFYEAGAELVLNGHEHNYERFAPMNAEGQADPLGIREFVLGTGGRDHYDFDNALPTSEVRDNTSYGVLKLTLHPTGYDWEFVPAAGSTFTDSGSGECH
ncbi:MAG TPA: DNRLRE domain-containing protein [Anaerolineales bacterium]|nr:DNRLRE domain-containing protein [Anaerolineales bacterium]